MQPRLQDLLSLQLLHLPIIHIRNKAVDRRHAAAAQVLASAGTAVCILPADAAAASGSLCTAAAGGWARDVPPCL